MKAGCCFLSLAVIIPDDTAAVIAFNRIDKDNREMRERRNIIKDRMDDE